MGFLDKISSGEIVQIFLKVNARIGVEAVEFGGTEHEVEVGKGVESSSGRSELQQFDGFVVAARAHGHIGEDKAGHWAALGFKSAFLDDLPGARLVVGEVEEEVGVKNVGLFLEDEVVVVGMGDDFFELGAALGDAPLHAAKAFDGPFVAVGYGARHAVQDAEVFLVGHEIGEEAHVFLQKFEGLVDFQKRSGVFLEFEAGESPLQADIGLQVKFPGGIGGTCF